MLFNTFQFLMFYVVCLIVNAVLRGTSRKVFLLLASYYFYMCWNTRYIWVIIAITLVDYVAGLVMFSEKRTVIRRVYLTVSLACNLGLLIFFKYFNFLSTSMFSAARVFGSVHDPILLHIILPVGLSFHTFQAMSYTIDVYKKKVPAERNILNYALYVAYFPQMVAGPIERPNQLLPQFHRDPTPRADRIRSGTAQALWGLFKKMVIADGLSGFVNLVYAKPMAYTGSELLAATLCFAIQIYCDFSGYTDIALGTSRIMGYELRTNFTQPYFSRSIGEFWHRWHISLSTWFRDYVYIPLGGNRVSTGRVYANIMITFVLSGLWHGSSWNFVIWGGLNGLYLIASRETCGARGSIRKAFGLEGSQRLLAAIQMSITFFLVCFAWVFFRARTLKEALYVLSHLARFGAIHSSTIANGGLTLATLPFLMSAIVGMFFVEWCIMHPHRAPSIWQRPTVRIAAYQLCTFSIIFFGVFGHIDFIYFQF